MKVTVELDCSPEEARRSLGLPDVTKVNELYVETITKAMQRGGFEHMQEYAKQIAPMGQAGLKLFQKMLESGAAMRTMGTTTRKPRDKDAA